MKPVDLIALASAHGIDLQHIAGNASKTDGVAKKLRRTRSGREWGRDIEETVTGSSSRVYRRPAWTHADTGAFSHDVPRMPWLAIRFRIAGDHGGYKELCRGLTMQALRLATRHDWPLQVKKADGSQGFYVSELAALVLDSDFHKADFDKYPILYPACVGVSPDIWEKVVVHYFDDLKSEYDRWVAVGLSIIRREIMDEAPEEAA